MRDQISTLRDFCGLAGGSFGNVASVASILVTSFGHGTVGSWLRPPQRSLRPLPPPRPWPAGAAAPAAGGAACCATAAVRPPIVNAVARTDTDARDGMSRIETSG